MLRSLSQTLPLSETLYLYIDNDYTNPVDIVVTQISPPFTYTFKCVIVQSHLVSQIESKPACHFSFQYQLWVISFNFPSCICRLFFWRTSELMLTKYYNVLLSAKILWKTKHRFLLTAIKSVSYIDNNVCKSRIMELEHTFSVIFILFLRKNPFKPPTQIKFAVHLLFCVFGFIKS